MSDDPELSIIVISYNTKEMTIDCLKSVFETLGGMSFELIVYDNLSTDGSAQAIADAYGDRPEMRFEALKQNLGFAGANNLAAKTAKGRYILLLNPDTIVHEEAIQILLSFAKSNPQGKIWGGRTFFGDGSLNATSCFRQPSLWSLFCSVAGLTILFKRSELLNPETYGAWDRGTVRQVDIVTGCFFLIKRDFWNELNGFDTRFFMFAEEADICLRAIKAGARPLVTPDATITHYGGASQKIKADRLTLLFKGKISLIDKHWSGPKRYLGKALLHIFVLNRWIAYSTAGRITKSPSTLQTSSEWAGLWRARGKWSCGY